MFPPCCLCGQWRKRAGGESPFFAYCRDAAGSYIIIIPIRLSAYTSIVQASTPWIVSYECLIRLLRAEALFFQQDDGCTVTTRTHLGGRIRAHDGEGGFEYNPQSIGRTASMFSVTQSLGARAHVAAPCSSSSSPSAIIHRRRATTTAAAMGSTSTTTSSSPCILVRASSHVSSRTRQRRQGASPTTAETFVAPSFVGALRRFRVLASAADDDSSSAPSSSYTLPGEPSYPGLYCDWSVTPEDKVEVWSYRACLSAVAVSCLVCSSSLVLGDAVEGALQPAYFLGAGGLGVALYLIHMYVDPIKKAMQAMWAVGFAGSVGIAAVTGEAVPSYVVHHPIAVWAVGPMFAALTGVAFKEGMCYGKAECAALFFVIPITLLGHLSGFAGEGTEKAFVAAWCVLITIFAGRKYTQAVKDDIGDKSVFIFNALSEAERGEWMMRARQRDPARFARMMGEE